MFVVNIDDLLKKSMKPKKITRHNFHKLYPLFCSYLVPTKQINNKVKKEYYIDNDNIYYSLENLYLLSIMFDTAANWGEDKYGDLGISSFSVKNRDKDHIINIFYEEFIIEGSITKTINNKLVVPLILNFDEYDVMFFDFLENQLHKLQFNTTLKQVINE